MNDKESFWIASHNSTDKNHGYNLRTGGMNSFNSPETRRKISKANKGRIFTKEHCRRISEGKKGWKWSEQDRINIMDGRVNGKDRWSDEARTKHSESRKKENLLPVTRKKISEANTGVGNGRAILTEVQVFEIKRLIAAGETGVSIARKFPVCRTAIMRIKHNKSWRHIAWP